MKFRIVITLRLTSDLFTLHLLEFRVRIYLIENGLAHFGVVIVLSDLRICFLAGFLPLDKFSKTSVHPVFKQKVLLWVFEG